MSLLGMRLRRAIGSLLFLLFLAVAIGAALLTRFPDAPMAEWATGWPVVGDAVGALRSRYLSDRSAPAPVPSRDSGELDSGAEASSDVVVIVGEARPTVWVDEGAVLRAEPDEAAGAVATLDALTNLPVVEWSDDWAWVDFRGVMGWVVPRPRADHGPAFGSRPDPVLPIAARPPEPQLLEAALGQFPRRPMEVELGGYRLFTDWSGPEVVERCRSLEAGLEDAYRARFRLAPVGDPAEVVLLFAGKDDYDAFWSVADGRGISSVGHAGRGMVATFVGLRHPREVCATLIHELTHLLNRRAVGPALPPWLEEGMATEIAARHAGSPLEPRLVRMAARQGRLPRLTELLELDRPRFHDAGLRRVRYEQSALWLRFLLDDPGLGERLLAFLEYLARGGPYGPDLPPERMAAERQTTTLSDDLVAFLGQDLESLEVRFRSQLGIERSGLD